MTLPTSPFFDIENPDPRYLQYLDKWHWKYTCRCMKPHDRIYDIERAMFVCDICFLPSGFKVESGQFVEECMTCGDAFVVWRNHSNGLISDFLCGSHGGTNAAAPGARNYLTDSQADLEMVD